MDICSGLLDRGYSSDVLFFIYPIPLHGSPGFATTHLSRGTIHHQVTPNIGITQDSKGMTVLPSSDTTGDRCVQLVLDNQNASSVL